MVYFKVNSYCVYAIFLIFGFFYFNSYANCNSAPFFIRNYWREFGGWSIDKELFNYIRNNLQEGSTILELGSGWSSQKLSEHYIMYSVEHNPYWLDTYKTNYIYAPIVDGWYDVNQLKQNLPSSYDLILIDGPPGNIGRKPFLDHIDLFNTNVLIVIDDVHREPEYELMESLAATLHRSYEVHQGSKVKKFGVIK